MNPEINPGAKTPLLQCSCGKIFSPSNPGVHEGSLELFSKLPAQPTSAWIDHLLCRDASGVTEAPFSTVTTCYEILETGESQGSCEETLHASEDRTSGR